MISGLNLNRQHVWVNLHDHSMSMRIRFVNNQGTDMSSKYYEEKWLPLESGIC